VAIVVHYAGVRAHLKLTAAQLLSGRCNVVGAVLVNTAREDQVRWRANEFVPCGRLAQSMAFFRLAVPVNNGAVSRQMCSQRRLHNVRGDTT
jgi:hypothetical protein